MWDQLLGYDKELFLYLNGLGTARWDAFWLFITGTLGAVPLYVLLLILVYRYLGLKKTLLLLVAVALMITCTDQLSNFFKYGVQRLRPCHDPEVEGIMRLVKSYCGGRFTFFSAHAANSFAVAVFFALLFWSRHRWVSYLLPLWALMVAYSRIYIGVHFPLDVGMGAAVGGGFGWLYYKLYIFVVRKAAV